MSQSQPCMMITYNAVHGLMCLLALYVQDEVGEDDSTEVGRRGGAFLSGTGSFSLSSGGGNRAGKFTTVYLYGLLMHSNRCGPVPVLKIRFAISNCKLRFEGTGNWFSWNI